MEKNKKTKKNKKFRPMGKVWGEAWQGTWVWTFFFWFFVFHCFLQFGQNLEKTKKKVQTHGQGLGYPHTNQKTQKKKLRNQKPKKKDCTPQGEGVRCRVLGLVFLFFLFFFFFCLFLFFFCFFGLCVDSHCRCAKQRLPGTVSGCTRSKVDTLQYSNVCYDIDIVHSANEQQRGMEFNFVRLRHMLLDLCTGNAAICALPWWPVLFRYPFSHSWLQLDVYSPSHMGSCPRMGPQFVKLVQITTILFNSVWYLKHLITISRWG